MAQYPRIISPTKGSIPWNERKEKERSTSPRLSVRQDSVYSIQQRCYQIKPRRICFNFLMNGIVRASIHIYNYKQASVHKTDEVVRSCQAHQIRQSLQTNPTWTQQVKKFARAKRVASFLSITVTCQHKRLTHQVPFMVRFLVLSVRFCVPRFRPCLVIDRS